MILANSTWGKLLDDHDVAGIYRTQNNGKVKMSTIAAPHQGLGVAHYAWSSSPLRRYVDMVNQRQIISVLRGEPPAYARNDTALFSILSNFDTAYTTYNEFQRSMERYWCLRWLLQEKEKLEALTRAWFRGAIQPGLPCATFPHPLSILASGREANERNLQSGGRGSKRIATRTSRFCDRAARESGQTRRHSAGRAHPVAAGNAAQYQGDTGDRRDRPARSGFRRDDIVANVEIAA